MGKRPFWGFIVGLLLLAACQPETAINAPRLVQEATLAPTTPAATRLLSPTPTPTITPTPLVIPVSTSEINAPLIVATVDVDFVLVTPTLPPSKTPTPTVTSSATPTITSTPTNTLPPTFSQVIIPTNVIARVITQPPPIVQNPPPAQQPPPVAQQPPAQPCTGSQWFFAQPRPSSCPSGTASSSSAALEQFQQGYMIWIGAQDAIYVLYDSETQPRWQVFNDTFEDGMIEYDPHWGPGPPYTYQPKRGFGKLWRDNAEVRQRLGWSVREWSEPYTAQVQMATDGSIFIQESRGGVFQLLGGGTDWKRYDGSFGF